MIFRGNQCMFKNTDCFRFTPNEKIYIWGKDKQSHEEADLFFFGSLRIFDYKQALPSDDVSITFDVKTIMAGQKSKAKNDRFSIISVILIFLFSHNDCSDAISEFYLDDDAVRNSVCGDVLTLNDSLFLKSQIGAGLSGGLNNYKSNQNCGTTVTAENGVFSSLRFVLD